MPSFADALAAGPIVLDGGLGTLLEAHGHDVSSSLWSGRLLFERPEAIRAAHAEFFSAGARIAISASYQVSYEGMQAAGLTRSQVDALLARSVQLAREGRDDAGLTAGGGPNSGPTTDAGWVAASVGPYGAVRADGSEYTGDYGLSVAELRAWHRPRLRALADAGPDLLAIETIPSLAEAEALGLELEGIGVPAFFSVTVADGALRSGEPLGEAFSIAAAGDDVVAVGVNCCDAREVPGALAALRAVTTSPGVAYPNSGEKWGARTRRWTGEATDISDHTSAWTKDGALLIGGCCRVGPGQIAAVARATARSRSRDGDRG